MIEREFRITLDWKRSKKDKNFLLASDIMDARKNKTDLEITMRTPDGREHSKFITRRNLARVGRIGIEMYLEDTVQWKAGKWDMENGVRI